MKASTPPRASGGAFLALDVGDSRIGVALSRSGIIAEPLRTIFRKKSANPLEELAVILEEEKVHTCVVGMPFLESGEAGEQVAKTRAFCRRLLQRLPSLAIEEWDERYTSAEARERLSLPKGVKDSRGEVDKLAATILLQEFLDHHNTRAEQNT